MRTCPFCGNDEIEILWVDPGYRAVCFICEAQGPQHIPKDYTLAENNAARQRAETAWEGRA